MRRLIREGNPPSGQLASPVPQYWNPSTEAFEDVLGAHGAPRAILYGPNGQPISQSNPLEVRVRELEAELAAMRGMLETGDAKVTLTGILPQPDAPLPVDIHGGVFDEPELVEQLTERDAVGGVLTFTNTIHHVEIFNTDDTNTGAFVVNGIEILMPPGAVFNARIGGTPSNTVTVSGATSYIIGRYV